MYYAVISILSILTESLFISAMLYRIKKIESGYLKLFFVVISSYFLSGLLISFSYPLQIWFYLIFNTLMFLFLKLKYKKEINILDYFIIGYLIFIVAFIGMFATFLEAKFDLIILISFIIGRILLLLLFFFSRKSLDTIYCKYSNIWHRRDDGTIKAITVRNLTLVMINIILYILSLYLNMAIMY